MNTQITLTKRESEIAELFAWGAAKKEVADKLFISEHTVENHARNIYEKIGCNKVNELSAWWFCTHFNISFDLSPLKQRIIAFAMLFIITPQILSTNDNIVRVFRARTATRTCRTVKRKAENDDNTFGFLV